MPRRGRLPLASTAGSAVVVASLAVWTAGAAGACGFDGPGTGVAEGLDARSGRDAPADAAEEAGLEASTDFELPAPPDASTGDAAADGAACGSAGAPCEAQTDCCAKTFCGRKSSFPPQPYSCTACLAAEERCSDDVQCCSGRCTFSSFSYRCRE